MTIDALTEIHRRVDAEPWIEHLFLDVWGHGVSLKCTFNTRDNGSGICIGSEEVQGLINAGELQGVVGIASWTQGMGDGYFIQELRGCNWDAVCYTCGLNCLGGEDINTDKVFSVLKEKFDAMVEKLAYIERLKAEHGILEKCGYDIEGKRQPPAAQEPRKS